MSANRIPPAGFFVVSAVFHYLGPSFAVLLFAHVSVLGVAWLRIASAALVFALWRRPWRVVRRLDAAQRWLLVALGVVLAVMNALFYLAVDRLPLATVGAVEFLGVVLLAAAGTRTPRNLLALLLAVGGVVALTDVRLAGEPLGFAFAFANCAGFVLYVVLGHRIARAGRDDTDGAEGRAGAAGAAGADGAAADGVGVDGIDRLAVAMLVAAVVATPFCLPGALPAFANPAWLLWGVAVGLCSSVVPYVTDQLAMARLPRATFALMLAILPATATVIGLLVLEQTPTLQDLAGIGLVIAGVALRRAHAARSGAGATTPVTTGPRGATTSG